jgi:opacity protein-like surface antigen
MAEVKAIIHFPPVDLSSLIDWEPSDNDQPDRWNLALGYGTNPSFAMPPEDYVIEETRSTFAHDNFSSDMAFDTAYFEQIESTDHKFPVGLGLMAGFSLSRRWQVESGVVYTRLTTVNRTFAMNSMYREFENSISYLGVPIGIRYHMIHRDLWTLYVGQSLVIEKGLRNRFTTYYYENDVEVNAEATYAPVRGVQVSALSSLGVDFVLSGQFSLYFQGGIQYFFLNETQPYTIRSTNPVWPSVQTGIRYNFK